MPRSHSTRSAVDSINKIFSEIISNKIFIDNNIMNRHVDYTTQGTFWLLITPTNGRDTETLKDKIHELDNLDFYTFQRETINRSNKFACIFLRFKLASAKPVPKLTKFFPKSLFFQIRNKKEFDKYFDNEEKDVDLIFTNDLLGDSIEIEKKDEPDDAQSERNELDKTIPIEEISETKIIVKETKTTRTEIKRRYTRTTRSRTAKREQLNKDNKSYTELDSPISILSSDKFYIINREGTNRYKLGRSKNPKARMAQLQVGFDDNLILIDTCPGGSSIEDYFHQKHEQNNLRGEWYELSDLELSLIRRECLRIKSSILAAK